MAYITLSMAVAITGLSKRTLWRRIANGQLQAQEGTEPGEHTRTPLKDILPLSRLRLEPDDHTLIMMADRGDAEAQCDLALLFLLNSLPVEAVHWLSLSAKQQYPEALYQLGRCYIVGNGVEADEAKGIEFIARATTLGHGTAKYMASYLLDPTREALSPTTLESRLDTMEKNVVLNMLRETAHSA